MTISKWFKSIPNKAQHTFTIFDIAEFYPSIKENLLKKAINFAKQHTNVSEQDIKIIMHARKSLFWQENTLGKKDTKGTFDVTMGSYDGAEVCELVGAYILNTLATKHDKEQIGLYRDDGLAVFKDVTGSQAERIKKA